MGTVAFEMLDMMRYFLVSWAQVIAVGVLVLALILFLAFSVWEAIQDRRDKQ